MNQTPADQNESLAGIDVSHASLFKEGRHHVLFKRLRDEDPVHYCAKSVFGPYWSITRFEDIMAVEADHERFSSHRDIAIGDQPEGFAPLSFITRDPPVHDVHRRAVTPAVAPRRLKQLEPIIRGHVKEILRGLPENEPFDWVPNVSRELTTRMLAALFGVPFEDRHLLPAWSDAITASPSVGVPGATNEKREAAMQECLRYFSDLWLERDKISGGSLDFLSLLAHDEHTRYMIDDPMDFLGTLALLIVGGNDTTRNSISGGVVALNRFPGEYQKLVNNPKLISSMVPEIIRFQTPLAHMRRTASQDTVFKGKQIRKGDRVVMWYVSGNRDERAITDPDSFIVDRKDARRHLSFGFGIHRCLGNRLAELQLRVLWEELLQDYGCPSLAGEPERVASNFVMGWDSVPVVVGRKR